jgi:hypothetical protein
LADPDPAYKKQVFAFMGREVEQQALKVSHALAHASSLNSAASSGGGGGEDAAVARAKSCLSAMKSAAVVELAALVDLDRGLTVKLTQLLFANDHKRVLKALSSAPKQQYSLLGAMVQLSAALDRSGAVGDRDLDKGGGLRGGLGASSSSGGVGELDVGGDGGDGAPVPLDASDLKLYVQLMAKFEPGAVYPYLSTHTDYPLEDCIQVRGRRRALFSREIFRTLPIRAVTKVEEIREREGLPTCIPLNPLPVPNPLQVCREHAVTDAEAYLLERTGDISGALDLILRSIEHALAQLKTKLRTFSTAALVSQGVVTLLASSGGGGGGVRGDGGSGVGGTATAASANARAVFRGMAQGAAVERNLRVAIEVCERATARQAAAEAGSAATSNAAAAAADEQRLWNYLLDRLLLAKATLKLGGEAATHKLVLESVLTEVTRKGPLTNFLDLQAVQINRYSNAYNACAFFFGYFSSLFVCLFRNWFVLGDAARVAHHVQVRAAGFHRAENHRRPLGHPARRHAVHHPLGA